MAKNIEPWRMECNNPLRFASNSNDCEKHRIQDFSVFTNRLIAKGELQAIYQILKTNCSKQIQYTPFEIYKFFFMFATSKVEQDPLVALQIHL